MTALPLRLLPGADLRRELARAAAGLPGAAGFVLSSIGSLGEASRKFIEGWLEKYLAWVVKHVG